MINLNKKINLITWNYEFIDIEAVFKDASRIDVVYSVSENNNGYLSYNPSSSFNSLLYLEPFKSYIAVLKSSTYTKNINLIPVPLRSQAAHISGPLEIVEYKGSTTVISSLPVEYLSKYKTIYSVNASGTGFVSYSTNNTNFNTLNLLNNGDVLIIEKTDNSSITFYDNDSNFPSALNNVSSGPGYCQAPSLWRVGANGESFCYTPDTENDAIDPADIEEDAEVALNPPDCQGSQRSGLTLLGGDNRFVDFAPCGCYLDLPFAPIDLAILLGGGVFIALRGLKLTKLRSLLRSIENQIDYLYKTIISWNQRKFSASIKIKQGAYLRSIWLEAYSKLDPDDEDYQILLEYITNQISLLNNEISVNENIIEQAEETIQQLLSEKTVKEAQEQAAENALNNPSLIDSLFPEIAASASTFIGTIIGALTLVVPKNCASGVTLNQNTCICSGCSDPDKILCDKINTFTPGNILVDYDTENYCFSCCEGFIPNSMPAFPFTACSCDCLPGKEALTCLSTDCESKTICADPNPPDYGTFNPIFGTSQYAWNGTLCEWQCVRGDCTTTTTTTVAPTSTTTVAPTSTTTNPPLNCEDIEGKISFECLNLDNPLYGQCMYCDYDGTPGGPPFFDPVRCSCFQNCEDIINNLPLCSNNNQRNPETCECCEGGRIPCGTQCVIDDCAAQGLDPSINSMVMNRIGGLGPTEEDACYCECTGGDDLCENIGYDEMLLDLIETTDKYGNDTFITKPCVFPDDCKCREGREFGPVILPDGTVVNKCRSIIPYGACCDGLECIENYEENCIGKVFYRDKLCSELAQTTIGSTGDCPVCINTSDEDKKSYICENIPSAGDDQGCVFCDINQFFNPITCTCHNNCIDIIDDLPPCTVGNRNPNTCLCCPNNDQDNNTDPNLPSDRLGEESFGFSPCLNDCAYCVNRSPLGEGALSWNEEECRCECSANESCVDLGQSSLKVFNDEDCSCECPMVIRGYCNSRGYQFNSINCTCTCDDDSRRAKCPTAPFGGKSRWNDDSCECNCAQDPNNPRPIFEPCPQAQIRNPDSCGCECPEGTTTECSDQNGVPYDFNPITCSCEPRKNGSWCVGQFCPPNTFEIINGELRPSGTFYITGCEEGTRIDWLAGNAQNKVQSFRQNTSCVDSEELGCAAEQLPPSCTTTTSTTPPPTTSTTPPPTTSTTSGPTSTTSGPPNTILVDAEWTPNSTTAKLIFANIQPSQGNMVAEIEAGLEKANVSECCSDAVLFKNEINVYQNYAEIPNSRTEQIVNISVETCDATTTSPPERWVLMSSSGPCKRSCEFRQCLTNNQCFNSQEECECGDDPDRCVDGSYCIIDPNTLNICSTCCQESCLKEYKQLESQQTAINWEENKTCDEPSSFF